MQIKILAISGSLRAASLNSAMLRVMARLAGDDMQIILYDAIGNLPLFNPDIEASDPAPVAAFREQIMAADALLIASPEYAHGITGVMKNALDWMVSCEAFVNKPVAILNASPRATFADASLREIVTMMSAIIIEEASITVPIIGARLDEEGIFRHPEISTNLIAALATIKAHVLSKKVAT
jgi:NAD(P)H-dependent FMN reductase